MNMIEAYSKREQDGMFERLNERMQIFEKDARESLQRIEMQTTATNGRVRKLEQWQSYVIGFCACLGIILFSILIPLISSLIQSGKL